LGEIEKIERHQRGGASILLISFFDVRHAALAFPLLQDWSSKHNASVHFISGDDLRVENVGKCYLSGWPNSLGRVKLEVLYHRNRYHY
jgi:hypothetical protein